MVTLTFETLRCLNDEVKKEVAVSFACPRFLIFQDTFGSFERCKAFLVLYLSIFYHCFQVEL